MEKTEPVHLVGSSAPQHDARNFTFHVFTAALIGTFYLCGIGTVTMTKVIMGTFPLTLCLCTLQFGMASILTVSGLVLVGKRKSGYPDLTIKRLVVLTGAAYAMGFVLLNGSMQWATAPLAETVRALEPFSTVIMGSFFLKERSSVWTLFTLLPICGGVMLSCASNTEFSALGFAFVMLSNFAFSGRAVCGRLIQQINPECLEPFNFFADISISGFLLLLPIAAVVEGPRAYALLFSTAQSTIAASEDTTSVLLPNLLINAVMYTIYTLSSFAILQRTDLITHAAVNVFRRVFSIMFTALYFGVELNFANLTGIFVAVCGALMFTYFKSKETVTK